MPRKPRTQHDPLLEAVIAKLPARDAGFPAAEREAWLKLLVNALDVAYGVAGVTAASAAPQLRRLRAVEDAKVSHPFRVDPDGFARGPQGQEILAGDVPRGEILWDLRREGAGNLSTVIWLDGTWPAVTGITLQIAEKV